VPPIALPPEPPVALPPPPIGPPPLPAAALPPAPVPEPCITPVTQALNAAQAVMPRHALYAISTPERAAPGIDASDVSITFWHWPAVIPESPPHASARLQTSPATSPPPAPPQPATPIATSATMTALHDILRIVSPRS